MAQYNPPPTSTSSLPQADAPYPQQDSSQALMPAYAPHDPPPPPPNSRSPDTRPRGPSLLNQQIPSTPPIPQHPTPYFPQYPPAQLQQQQQQQLAVVPQQAQPQQQLQPYHDPHPSVAFADPQQYSSSPGSSSYMRARDSSRRLSASSAHSAHSGDHHGSHHSRHSSRSRSGDGRQSYEYDDAYNDGSDKGRRHSRHRDGDQKHSKHFHEHRPTWGDTIYGIFDFAKESLGSRDKH